MKQKKKSFIPLLIVLFCIAGIGWIWYSMAGDIAGGILHTADAPSMAMGSLYEDKTMASQADSVESSSLAAGEGDGGFQLMKESIEEQRDSVFLAGVSREEFEQAYNRIVADPMLFGVNGCNYTSSVIGVDVKWIWNCSDYLERRTAAEAAADEILSGVDANASDYDKVLYVNDWLCRNVTYETSKDTSDQSIYGALVERKAVCSGYCNAFAYLLGRMGIETSIIKGTAENESHAWNSVVLDGEIYYCDITWDDQESGGDDFICYSWFCLTSDDMLRQHAPANAEDMPYSAATQYNYYVHNGWELTEWNKLDLIHILSMQSDRATMTVRCADDAVYAQMTEVLFTNNEVGQILRAAGISADQIQYSGDTEMRTLTFLTS